MSRGIILGLIVSCGILCQGNPAGAQSSRPRPELYSQPSPSSAPRHYPQGTPHFNPYVPHYYSYGYGSYAYNRQYSGLWGGATPFVYNQEGWSWGRVGGYPVGRNEAERRGLEPLEEFRKPGVIVPEPLPAIPGDHAQPQQKLPGAEHPAGPELPGAQAPPLPAPPPPVNSPADPPAEAPAAGRSRFSLPPRNPAPPPPRDDAARGPFQREVPMEMRPMPVPVREPAPAPVRWFRPESGLLMYPGYSFINPPSTRAPIYGFGYADQLQGAGVYGTVLYSNGYGYQQLLAPYSRVYNWSVPGINMYQSSGLPWGMLPGDTSVYGPAYTQGAGLRY